MTCYEIRVIDEVRRLDRICSESQVGDGNPAGFLGVVFKITLCIHIGFVADNLDRTLIGADRTIGTEAPELALDRPFFISMEILNRSQGFECHIIRNTDSEVILRIVGREVFIDCSDLGRSRILGRQTKTAAAYLWRVFYNMKHTPDIEQERFTRRARFFGSVEYGDSLT